MNNYFASNKFVNILTLDLFQLLQDLKKEYVKLEKKIERRGKENIGTDEESDDASTSAEEA